MSDPIQSAWRAQATETPAPAFNQIQDRLKALRTRSRRAMLVTMVGAAVGLFIAGLQWRVIPTAPWRLGVALTALGYLAYLVMAYRRTSRDQAEVSVQACATFLRDALRRRLSAARGGWVLAAAPLLPGMAVSLIAMALYDPGPVARFAPIAALGGLWLAAMLLIQGRGARDLRQQIVELDAMVDA